MATVVAKIRKKVVQFDEDFIFDSSTDTILSVSDNKDGSMTILIMSCVSKGG